MLRGVAWLIGLQLVGEVVVRLLGLAVPGSVVGLLLLFVLLQRRRGARSGATADVGRAADALLRHLQLFFVPAGVGIVAYAATLRADAVPLALGLLGSWLLALVAVGRTAQALGRRSLPAPGAEQEATP